MCPERRNGYTLLNLDDSACLSKRSVFVLNALCCIVRLRIRKRLKMSERVMSVGLR